MFKGLGKILGIKPGADLVELISNGAQIIDVRSRGEYASGHLKGSINIPLNEIAEAPKRIDKRKPVIVCCASGVRSASAKSWLEEKGFDVYNGGGWQSLQNKIYQ